MSTEPADISQLTESQQEALQTYTSVTDQDPIAAIPILQRAQWNVQIAITRFFEGEPTTDILAEAQAQANVPPPTSRQTANLQFDAFLDTHRTTNTISSDDVVHQIETSPNVIQQYQPGILLSILVTPVSILYRVAATVLAPFSFLIPTFLSRLITNLLRAPRPARRLLPPSETSLRFIREFDEQYPSLTNLPWSTNGFNLSLDTARKTQKFFLVILLSPSHDDTQSYVRETLQSSTFISFLNTHSSEIILWGGNLQDNEAYQVSNNVSCTKFPFAALICQTPSSMQSSNASGGNMTVVSRLTGLIPATEMVAKLSTAITAHQAALRGARAQQAEQQASRSLRQEQDSAYERSLAQDRERARIRREEEETRAKAEKEALRKIEELELLKTKRDQWRVWRAYQIHPEPNTDSKDAVRVSIRMKDGQRIVRKFRADDNVEELYSFVECYDLLETTEELKPLEGKPTQYNHEYKFRLVSPMPRTVYDLEQGGTIARKIGKNANLLVEALDDDDDDDNDDEGVVAE